MRKPEKTKVTIKSELLLTSFDKYYEEFNSSYPFIKNTSIFLSSIKKFHDKFSSGANQLIIKLIPTKWAIILTKETSDDYSIIMLNWSRQEAEAVSLIGDTYTTWSSDTLSNSKDKIRTKLYLGFIYFIYNMNTKAGEELKPEHSLSVSELLNLADGEIPAEFLNDANSDSDDNDTNNSNASLPDVEKDYNLTTSSHTLTDSTDDADGTTPFINNELHLTMTEDEMENDENVTMNMEHLFSANGFNFMVEDDNIENRYAE